jgi:hypothetical protein
MLIMREAERRMVLSQFLARQSVPTLLWARNVARSAQRSEESFIYYLLSVGRSHDASNKRTPALTGCPTNCQRSTVYYVIHCTLSWRKQISFESIVLYLQVSLSIRKRRHHGERWRSSQTNCKGALKELEKRAFRDTVPCCECLVLSQWLFAAAVAAAAAAEWLIPEPLACFYGIRPSDHNTAISISIYLYIYIYNT